MLQRLEMVWPPSYGYYEKIVFTLHYTPKVVIDNAVCPNATIVMVNGLRNHRNLSEVVQVLADLNLSIKKAYISSDGRWAMDVFHVTDETGKKLTDDSVISYMEQSLAMIHYTRTCDFTGLTALELTGADRVGLLSEVFAVLSDLQCNIVEGQVWTHNGRIASLIYVKDSNSGTSIENSQQINLIVSRLRNVLKGDNDIRSAKTVVPLAVTHTERRLHQMMSDDRDYERKPVLHVGYDSPSVTVQILVDRGYSDVNVKCKDRTKLLFDVVCTLTDMEYVVFHAAVNTSAGEACMEFYIRRIDGTPINSEAEGDRVILCVKAAIERRAPAGVQLELGAIDRLGLLANVTRTFRENGLNVTGCEVSTISGIALDVFSVTDAKGNPVDPKIIESVRDQVGRSNLQVKEVPAMYHETQERRGGDAAGIAGAVLNLGSILRRNLYNLGLIWSGF